jgi:hypothetical protein
MGHMGASLHSFRNNNIINMNYQFPFFDTTISNPEIEVVYITDDLRQKACRVDVLLSTPEQDYGVNLDGFTYKSTFTKDEVIEWTFNELKKYEI